MEVGNMQGIKNTIDQIWTHVQKTDYCWLWTGRVDRDGYGIWWLEGKNVRPHRLVCEMYGRPIVPPLVSRHLCNVRNCVNPNHIEPGTQQENVQDQLMLGTHSKLKYTEELVQKIRTEYLLGGITQRALAEKYRMSKSHVHSLINNHTRTIRKEVNG